MLASPKTGSTVSGISPTIAVTGRGHTDACRGAQLCQGHGVSVATGAQSLPARLRMVVPHPSPLRSQHSHSPMSPPGRSCRYAPWMTYVLHSAVHQVVTLQAANPACYQRPRQRVMRIRVHTSLSALKPSSPYHRPSHAVAQAKHEHHPQSQHQRGGVHNLSCFVNLRALSLQTSHLATPRAQGGHLLLHAARRGRSEQPSAPAGEGGQNCSGYMGILHACALLRVPLLSSAR